MSYRFEQKHASAVALGQMLHIAQDSLSKCHAERDSNRRIVRYLSYTYRNRSKHSEHDAAAPAFKSEPAEALNPVAFGKELIAFWVDGAPWETVEPLVQRYFEPQDGTQPAVAGKDCK